MKLNFIDRELPQFTYDKGITLISKG